MKLLKIPRRQRITVSDPASPDGRGFVIHPANELQDVHARFRKLKLSHHKHTARLRPHEYTSYGPLILLLLVVGVVLTIGSKTVLFADTPYTHPGSGSIGLTGIMPGPAPTTGATILVPTGGQHFGSSPVTVSGTCPKNTLVEIYKNNIFAGSTPCDSNGKFSLKVDLLFGGNTLDARVYDNLNQAGPDSNHVKAYYDFLPPQSSSLAQLNIGNSQLILATDAIYRGIFPGQTLNVPISIIGGVPPYAINVQWGDNTNKVVSRTDNLTFNISHAYKKAGVFQLNLQGSDAQNHVAFLTVAVVVNGQPPSATSSSSSKSSTSLLLALWPLYASAVTVVISFWLGERREKKVLAKQVPTYPHTI